MRGLPRFFAHRAFPVRTVRERELAVTVRAMRTNGKAHRPGSEKTEKGNSIRRQARSQSSDDRPPSERPVIVQQEQDGVSRASAPRRMAVIGTFVAGCSLLGILLNVNLSDFAGSPNEWAAKVTDGPNPAARQQTFLDYSALRAKDRSASRAASSSASSAASSRASQSLGADQEDRDGPSRELHMLTDTLDRQISEKRLDLPEGDNAFETYQKIVATSASTAAIVRLGERLSAAVWLAARAAENNKEWDRAIKYYAALKRLPAAPLSMLEVEARTTNEARTENDLKGTSGSAQVPSAMGSGRVMAGAAGSGDALEGQAAVRNDMSTTVADSVRHAAAPDGQEWPTDSRADSAAIAIGEKRGDEMMRVGDIVAARLYYELSAARGNATAAAALGRSYDPYVIGRHSLGGAQPSTERAKYWYQRAIEWGDTTSVEPLKRITNSARVSDE
jgi:hypothetical protein